MTTADTRGDIRPRGAMVHCPPPLGASALDRLRAVRDELKSLRSEQDYLLLELAQQGTQQQLATDLDVSRQRVAQLLADARRRLQATHPEFVTATATAIRERRLRARRDAGRRLAAANSGMTPAELRDREAYERGIEQQSDAQGWDETVRPKGARRASRGWRTEREPAPVTVRHCPPAHPGRPPLRVE